MWSCRRPDQPLLVFQKGKRGQRGEVVKVREAEEGGGGSQGLLLVDFVFTLFSFAYSLLCLLNLNEENQPVDFLVWIKLGSSHVLSVVLFSSSASLNEDDFFIVDLIYILSLKSGKKKERNMEVSLYQMG